MNAKESLQKRSNKSISQLFKHYLMLIEDLKFEHDQYVKKIKSEIPFEYHNVVDNANTFDEEKMSRIRKRVLDLGNDAIRTQENELQDFSVSFVFKN
jgi:hypothetical protein